MKNKNLFAILIVFVVLLNVSCQKKDDETIEFDNSYPLALAPDVSWAVINDPYVAYKQNANWNAKITGHCRKGEVLQVLGNTTDDKNQTWYKFELGWLPNSCLTVYSNRYKAQSVSNSFEAKK